MSKDIIKYITTDDFKANTVVEMNVDDSKINPIIIKCQKIYLQQALGSSFYDYLGSTVASSTTSTLERNLIVDYIQPMLYEAVLYEALPFINYKATNKAVVKQNSDNSIASDLAEIKYLRSNVKDMMDFMLERLNSYLVLNASLFPQYQNPTTPENLPKNTKSYFNGVYTSGRVHNLGNIDINRSKDDCHNC